MPIPVFIILIGIILVVIINNVSLIDLAASIASAFIVGGLTAGFAYAALYLSDKITLDLHNVDLLAKNFWLSVLLSCILVVCCIATVICAVSALYLVVDVFKTLFTSNREEFDEEIQQEIIDNEDTSPDSTIIDGDRKDDD